MINRVYILFALLLFSFFGNSQVITLLKPSKSQVWPSYSVQRIQWTSNNIDNIKIESSLDSGRTWTTIVSSYPASAEYYDWEVPNKVSDSCYIRLSDVLNVGASSSNFKDKPFIIPKPSIVLDSLPASVFNGTMLPISWSISGVKKINIYISYDNKVRFNKIGDSITANTGYFNWIIKDTTAANCFLRIEDASNPILVDTLKVKFSIIALPKGTLLKYKGGNFDGHTVRSNNPVSLTVISPNLKDSLVGSLIYSIKWKSINVEQLKIEYTIDNGLNWLLVANNVAAIAGQFDWVVPNSPTSNGRIRITDLSNSTIKDESDSLFVIRKKELKINYPSVGDRLVRGTAWPISWSSLGITKVKLRILNPSSLIADSLLAISETFNWVAGNLPDSFRIIISDVSDISLNDTTGFLKTFRIPNSDNRKYRGGGFDGHSFFTNQKSNIKISMPSGNKVLAAGSTLTFQWKSVNVERINVLLSLDSLKTWTNQAFATASSAGTYSLKMPNISAANCFIKLQSASDSLVSDISDSAFSLLSKRIKNTTDSTNWIVGNPKMITWESYGLDSISIAYRTSRNGSWIILNNSYSTNAEVFNWVVPAKFDSLWVKIADVFDVGLISEASFFGKIQGSKIVYASLIKYRGGGFDGHSIRSNINRIIITKPEPNEVIISGNNYNINWSTINLSDSIYLQYSIDSGKTWINIEKVLATVGTYVWSIPSSAIKSSSSPIMQLGSIISNSVQNIITSITSEDIISLNNTENTAINSDKCLIRGIDFYNKNEIVGISPKPFTIKAKQSKLLNKIDFNKPQDMVWPDGSSQKLFAKSTSGKTVTFVIEKGDAAKIVGDSIFATKSGSIVIVAFSLEDTNYLASDTVRFSICINPTTPSKTNLFLCNFSKTDSLTATATTGNSLRWYGTSSTGGTATTTAPTASTSVVGTTMYYVSQINSSGCESERSAIEVTINPRPTAPTVNNSSACIGSVASPLSATSAIGNSLRWYGTSFTGGTSTSTAPSASTSVVGTTMYYVSQVNSSGCESERSAIEVTINARPTAPTVNNSSACIGSVASPLSATSATGNSLRWYGTSATGGTATTTAPTASTSVVGTMMYYVSQVNSSGCESDRAIISVTINPRPTVPTVINSSACIGSVATPLTATALTGNTLRWYGTSSTGGTATTTAPTASTSVVGTTMYYVSQVNSSGCESERAAIEVTINPRPTVTAITGTQQVCTGSTITFANTTSGGVWSSGTTTIATVNTAGVISGVSAGTASISYAVTNAGGCVTTVARDVTVNASPAQPLVNNSRPLIFCNGDSTILTANASTGLQWQLNASNISGATGSVITVKTSGTYSVISSNANNCSTSSANVTVVNNPIPNKPPINWNSSQFSTTSGLGSYQWLLTGNNIVGATSNTYTPVSVGLYTVRVSNASGCSAISDPYNLVVTAVTPVLVAGTSAKIYPNPASKQTLLAFDQVPLTPVIVKLTNANGITIKTFTTRQRVTSINIEGLASGTYYVQVSTGKQIGTMILFIQ